MTRGPGFCGWRTASRPAAPTLVTPPVASSAEPPLTDDGAGHSDGNGAEEGQLGPALLDDESHSGSFVRRGGEQERCRGRGRGGLWGVWGGFQGAGAWSGLVAGPGLPCCSSEGVAAVTQATGFPNTHQQPCDPAGGSRGAAA